MTWVYVDTIPGVSSGGPNPQDAFSIAIGVSDNNASPGDSMSVAFAFPEDILAPEDAAKLSVLFEDSNPQLSDLFTSLSIEISDSNSEPSDAATFVLTFFRTNGNVAPTDALSSLRVNGLGDTTSVPTDGKSANGYFWLSGTTGTSGNTTTPGNADGANDSVLASAKTVALGATTARLTSNVGSNIPNGTSFSAAIYRGWFNFLAGATSTKSLTFHSSTGLFSDVVAISQTTALDSSTGTYTFDLVAAGINTLAKLQSLQVYHTVVDAVAGTGVRIDVDAGRVELTGII